MGFVFREQINPTTVGPFMFKDWAHNNTPGKKGFQTGANASGERVVSKPWRDPPPALGVAGQTRRLGHSTADAFGTNTEMGRIGEQAFIDIAGGHLLHPEGRGELSPLDVRIDGYGFEVKSSSTLATGYKASPKPFEINEKRAFAKQIGVKPAMAIVVLDAAKGQAHAYWRPSLATGRLSRATGWRYLGSTLLPAQTASELFKEWAHNNAPGKKGFQPKAVAVVAAPVVAPSAPTASLWQGKITGGTPTQQAYVREALGQVPSGILPRDMDVVFSTAQASGKYATNFGVYRGQTIYLDPRYVKIGAATYSERPATRQSIIFDITHEAGHGVMSRVMGEWGPNRYRAPLGVSVEQLRTAGKSGDARIVSFYSHRNADEGWAELFASRVTHSMPSWHYSAENEAIFARLGI